MRAAGLPLQRLVSADAMAALAQELHFPDVTALYAAVGESHVGARHVIQRLTALLGGEEQAEEDIAERATPVDGPAAAPAARRASSCGATRGTSATSGPSSPAAAPRCPATTSWASSPAAAACRCTARTAPTPPTCTGPPERLVDVEWAASPGSVFLVAIQVEALDRHRLLSDVTKVLADERVNILSASVTTSEDRVAISGSASRWATPSTWATCSAVRNVEGVYDVYRVT